MNKVLNNTVLIEVGKDLYLRGNTLCKVCRYRGEEYIASRVGHYIMFGWKAYEKVYNMYFSDNIETYLCFYKVRYSNTQYIDLFLEEGRDELSIVVKVYGKPVISCRSQEHFTEVLRNGHYDRMMNSFSFIPDFILRVFGDNKDPDLVDVMRSKDLGRIFDLL